MTDSKPFAHKLLVGLDELCPSVAVQDLPEAVAIVERETRKQIEDAVRAICFPSMPDPNGTANLHGKPYEVRVSNYPDDPARLGIAVTPSISEGRLWLSRLPIKTPSLLRTQKAIVRLPEELLVHETDLADATCSIIGAGSTWLERRLIASLKVAEADAISSIYTYFISLLSREAQAIPVWFATASKDHSHYVLDPGVAVSALASLAASTGRRTSGAAAYMADFLNTMVPSEQAFATQVIKGTDSMEIDFKEAKYKSDFSSAQVAEIAMFGGESATLFPVCAVQDTYLIAVFPSKYNMFLVPVLEASRAELTLRFTRARSYLDRAYRRLKAQGWGSPGKWGEFFGGAVVGGANAMT